VCLKGAAGQWQEWALTFDDTHTVTGNVGVEFFASATSTGQPKEINIDMGSDPVRVPEPATLAFFGAGLAALGFAGRRRRRARPAYCQPTCPSIVIAAKNMAAACRWVMAA